MASDPREHRPLRWPNAWNVFAVTCIVGTEICTTFIAVAWAASSLLGLSFAATVAACSAAGIGGLACTWLFFRLARRCEPIR
jgi:hypothetical protein